MLLLVTLALVVASAVLLILGFVRDALGFIYLSMLCAGVAALALFVFARLNRRRLTALAGVGVQPPSSPPEPVVFAGATVSPTIADTAAVTVIGTEDDVPVDSFQGLPESATQVRPETAIWGPAEEGPDWGDEVVFPIEDYDDLRVAEILPLLGQLEPDELQEVRDRELAGKARGTILARIDDRLTRSGVGAAGRSEVTAVLPAAGSASATIAAGAAGGAIGTPSPAPTKAAGAARGAKAAGAARAVKAAGATRGAKAAGAARAAKAAGAARGASEAPAPAKGAGIRKSSDTRKAAGGAGGTGRVSDSAPAAGEAVPERVAAKKATPARRAAKKSP